MRRHIPLLLLALAVVLLVWSVPGDRESAAAASTGRGFSAVPVNPDTLQELRAQGRGFRIPFPNSINRGRKFNPGGSVIDPLTTASEQKVLVIFVQFTTPPPGGPIDRLAMSYFDDMLFGTVYDPPQYTVVPLHPTDRTLKNYYQQVSYGQVDVITLNLPSALGWKQVGRPYGYYCRADGLHDNGFGTYPENAQGLVIDAIDAVDPFVDFSQYAVDGEVPNLFVVHAGTGAEWSSDPSIIWSHSWSLDAGTGLDGYVADGVTLNNYAMMPEVGGDLTNYIGRGVTGPFPPTVGVYAHEYGHVLGLPDQYDYGYESEGTGIYSLMAGGSWNTWPYSNLFAGNSPAHLDAWSKYYLGFVSVVETEDESGAQLAAVQTTPAIYKMNVPFSDGREYFLFENRQQIGFDEGLKPFGAGVHGLAIYHVDETVLNRNYWRCNEAENWKEFRSEGWKRAWNGESHYAISLVQADDRWDLEHGMYWYYPGDLYPGPWNVTNFGNLTAPNSSSYYFWGGSAPKFGYSGVTVSNISETGGVITADFSIVPWSPGRR
jgi:M6 family metalloprotease-like protein